MTGTPCISSRAAIRVRAVHVARLLRRLTTLLAAAWVRLDVGCAGGQLRALQRSLWLGACSILMPHRSCANCVRAFCSVLSAVVLPLKGIPTSITLCLHTRESRTGKLPRMRGTLFGGPIWGI